MNHKKMYRQVFGCGQLLDSYEKANSSIKSPNLSEYNNLPEDIKAQFPEFSDYKKHVDDNNLITKNSMIVKLQEIKSDYKNLTGGSDEDSLDFTSEADELISLIEV